MTERRRDAPQPPPRPWLFLHPFRREETPSPTNPDCAAMEEGGFDLLRGPEAAQGSSLPPPLIGDACAGINGQCPTHLVTADGSRPEDQSMLGGDDIFFTAGTNGSLALQIEDPSLSAAEESLERLLDLDLDIDSLFSSGSGTSQESVDSQLPASAHHPTTQVGADSPPAPPPTEEDMMITLADMIRIAEECGKDEAAGRVWSGDEHKHLLQCLQRYAKHEGPNRCIHTSTSMHNKTAVDVALRCRWLLDKEKPAKQAELVHKDSAGVKVKKKISTGQGQGTKCAKKHSNMYPLSKEALDFKSTRELLRDSYIFMQQIEENIKSGKLGDDTADYFYYVKTIIDAIGKRENRFCRISIPMPPIDERGLEEILQQSRHSSSSAGKEAA